jgi:drug/metabolite transporter (DMT)-like permease
LVLNGFALKFASNTVSKSILHMLISTFSFGCMNVMVKEMGDFPAMEMMFFRCAVSMLMCFVILYREKINWLGSNRLLLLARGFFGTLSVFTFFVTLSKMPLGTAVTIQYLSPVFTAIFAIFLLAEPVKPLQWVFFTTCFCGVMIIKGFDARITAGLLSIGIISAAASGMAYNLVRSLRGKENPMVVVLHFQIVGAVVGLAFSLINWRMPQGKEWVFLILTGVCTQIGQVNLTRALQSEKIANVAILNYLGILYALIFGYTIFGEHYSVYTLAGILLVVSGVLANIFYMQMSGPLSVEQELTGDEE